jgi:hypothetical protein
MNAKRPVLWIFIFVIALLAEMGVMRAQTGGNADAVAAVTKLENDGVKADLANDKAFYEKVLAKDWTGVDSDGVRYTKADILKMVDDTQHNKTNSEKLFDLKVRVYGSAAVATYKDTYDAIVKGEHRSRTIVGTDTFVKIGGEWKQVATQGTNAK